MKKSVKSKGHDKEAMMAIEGSPKHEMAESPTEEHKEPPSDAELDMHYETMMKAHKIKNDASIMKHLQPHMEKKMSAMKSMGVSDGEKKITSIDGLKKAYKNMP